MCQKFDFSTSLLISVFYDCLMPKSSLGLCHESLIVLTLLVSHDRCYNRVQIPPRGRSNKKTPGAGATKRPHALSIPIQLKWNHHDENNNYTQH